MLCQQLHMSLHLLLLLVRRLISSYHVNMKEDAVSSAAKLHAREELASMKSLKRARWWQKGQKK